ncbi:MAG TPA: 2'-5' RNA ligase family protein [Actinomycetales bacterium]
MSEVLTGPVHASSVLIAVPELAAFTSQWRSTSYAPQAPALTIERRFPPHVTLLTPFGEPDDGELLVRLQRVATEHQPFELVFRRASRFGPDGAIWLVPEPVSVLRELALAVAAAFPEHPPYLGRYADPVPHLTVTVAGDDGTLAQVQAALDEHGPLTAPVASLGIWRRGDDDVWQLTAVAPLGG